MCLLGTLSYHMARSHWCFTMERYHVRRLAERYVCMFKQCDLVFAVHMHARAHAHTHTHAQVFVCILLPLYLLYSDCHSSACYTQSSGRTRPWWSRGKAYLPLASTVYCTTVAPSPSTKVYCFEKVCASVVWQLLYLCMYIYKLYSYWMVYIQCLRYIQWL